jgi:hypothetical protein
LFFIELLSGDFGVWFKAKLGTTSKSGLTYFDGVLMRREADELPAVC